MKNPPEKTSIDVIARASGIDKSWSRKSFLNCFWLIARKYFLLSIVHSFWWAIYAWLLVRKLPFIKWGEFCSFMVVRSSTNLTAYGARCHKFDSEMKKINKLYEFVSQLYAIYVIDISVFYIRFWRTIRWLFAYCRGRMSNYFKYKSYTGVKIWMLMNY